MEPEGLYLLHKNPELGPILSQFNPIQILAVFCCNINITCISSGRLPSTGLFFDNQSIEIFDWVVKTPTTYIPTLISNLYLKPTFFVEVSCGS